MQDVTLGKFAEIHGRRQSWVFLLAVALPLLAAPITAQVQVTTQHYDNARTGQILLESVLTPSNVNVQTFGKLWSYSVDGYVYAQPLYVPNVAIPGRGTHNVLYIATEHDSVYALDADSIGGEKTTPLWQTSFIDPPNGITTLSIFDVNCDAIVPEVGITSTPVIDISTNTIYVLAATKENGAFFNRLHALDITTGAEKFGGPVAIQGTYPGTGDGSSGGVITFNAVQQLNRPGLLLSNNDIHVAWASNCDNTPFHGWVMAYDKNTLQQTAVWAATPNGEDGGIWMSGAGMAADVSGNLFFATSNGTFGQNEDPLVDYGDSILRMTLQGNNYAVSDYFTPYDQNNMDQNDGDLGSGGVLLLPDQSGQHVHELVEAGKEGSIYLVDRDNMGHFNSGSNSQIVQNIAGQIQSLFAVPAYWNNNVYFAANNDRVRAFSLNNGLLSSTPTSVSPTGLGYPGSSPIISANGTSNAILWALDTPVGAQAVLHAYDATNLSSELYNTNQNAPRDVVGGAVKFAVPTVANGRAYVGADTAVSVYGLLASITPPPALSPASGTYAVAQTITISDQRQDSVIYYTTDGTTPTTSSPVYSGPLTVNSTTTLKAMAVATGASPSNVSWGNYTILVAGGFSYASGFGSGGMVLNGSATLNGSRLRLTDSGLREAGSAWYPTQLNIQSFTQDFSFQITNPIADGITFTIQNAGTTALGAHAGSLGYAPLPTSVAVKFDLWNNQGEGKDSTGLYVNGNLPTVPAVDMTDSGVNLHSGHVFNVHMAYDGTTLAMTITDASTQQSFPASWKIDIPGTVGGTTAYAGFTGGTGSAIQEILNWTFVPGVVINYGNGVDGTALALNGTATMNGSRLRLTDSGLYEAGSAWYNTPLNIQSFTQDFSFQLTNPIADGMTFVLQNAGTSALGSSAGGLGYALMPASVAIKFDLWNNQGEGMDSTGLYINGATPTVPAIDMTSSGVDLHSGHVFTVHMTYDGTTLTMTITDAGTQQSFATSWTIDIPTALGGPTAYAGFTGGTGGGGAIQEVLNWTFVQGVVINDGNGMNLIGMALNGTATMNGSRLRLTDSGLYEAASAWSKTPLNIQSFTQDFSFQMTNAAADGMTFAIQNAGTTALGSNGGGLGYALIPTSVVVKFDLFSNQGEGINSTGLYINGALPTVPAVDMTGSELDLHSGDVFNVHMTYDGITLGMTITDASTKQSFDTSWPIDIPGTVGGPTAYLGFTGGTGGEGAIQEILNWTFVGFLPEITPPPALSPAGGTYAVAQTITISDQRQDSVIYYTTDGTTPTTSSPVYSGPLTVNSTTTLKAMAVATGASPSNVSWGNYTILVAGGFSYASGFGSGGMVLNGSATLNGSRLRLTDSGLREAGSAWYPTQLNIQSFTQDFSFQITNPIADGITFTIQNAGTTALGAHAGSLGYAPLPTSVAVKFDLWNNQGEGKDSTGLYVNGNLPTVPAVDMTDSGVNLHSGHVFNVHMAYDGTTLAMTITDASTQQSFPASWKIDIPGTVGGTTAYAGFTGGTGSAIQEILNWTFVPGVVINYGNGVDGTALALNGTATMNGSRLRLTDSGLYEAGSAWYNTPLNIQSFTQDFSFQLTNPIADGMTFVLQNAGTSALGSSAGGLGYALMPASVAIKFDLWNNQGEGMDSTGLYINGATPTVPAIDMTSSGVDLHSGHVFTVHMTYDGTTLTMTITDAGTQQSFATSWTIDIPTALGGPTAYAGFTGGTGGGGAIQEVLNWTFVSGN